MRRLVIPMSGSRRQASITASRFIIGSPMPMKTAWSTRSMRRKNRAWSRISEAVRLRPNFIVARGAERAGQRATRLRGQAQRAPSVAVAHEHGLDGPAVVGVEERLDRAVGGLGLLDERRGSRAAPARRARSAARPGGWSSPRSPSRPARSTPRPASRGRSAGRDRPGSSREAAGPRDHGAMRLSRFLAHAGVASRRRAEDVIRAGRVRWPARRSTDPARDVGDDADVTVDGRARAPRVDGRLRRPQAARRRLHGARTPTGARPSSSSCPSTAGSTRSAASTPTRAG